MSIPESVGFGGGCADQGLLAKFVLADLDKVPKLLHPAPECCCSGHRQTAAGATCGSMHWSLCVSSTLGTTRRVGLSETQVGRDSGMPAAVHILN